MDTAQYSCPHCQQLFEAAVVYQPQTVACPHCGQATMIEPAAPREAIAAPPIGVPKIGSRRALRSRRVYFGWLLALAGLAAAVTFLMFSGRLPQLTGTSQSTDSQQPQNPADTYGHSSSREHWTDAENHVLRMAGFEIKVLRAELGPVLGRDSSGAVQTLAEDGLQIGLQIRNLADEPKNFQSWYALSRDENAQPAAKLVDNLGNGYPLLYFANVQHLRGHTAEADLEHHQRIEDVVIFHIQPEVDRNRVTHLYLTLEAAPLNSAGRFQFRIPISMIHNWQ